MRISISLFGLGGLALVGTLLGRAQLPAASEAAVPQEAVVTISLADGQVVASPDPVEIAVGDSLAWVSDDFESWTIRIPSAQSPFGENVRANGIAANRGQRRGARALPGSQGRYKYTIAAWDGQRVRILDPEIIVGGGS